MKKVVWLGILVKEIYKRYVVLCLDLYQALLIDILPG
jgi:hypothetical protein